ncbi:MAG: hypothetical protein ACYSUT_11300, partial [Planctomycetota bacterium]
LNSIHKINGKYYEFSTLEGKSKFAARLYAGDTGVFKVGKGGRDLEKAEFSGSVRSKEYAAAVGDVSEGWSKPTSEYTIPVGDYNPAIMSVTYDNLSISISNNYHRNAKGVERGNPDRKEVYGFKIRKDTPYVLDFSNEPVVIFDTPAPDKNRFKVGEKVGEEIKFAAVLVDAELDIMIRGLRDMSVEVEKEFKNPGGETTGTYKQKKSLDPSVVISRADGEVVAEGIMPYG